MGNRDFKLIKRSIHDISRNTGSGGKDYDKEIEELFEDVNELNEGKQDKLVAGDNVSIDEDNVISVTVPTKTSDLDNDSGYITGITEQDVTDALGYEPSDFSGDYDDLENKPTIPTKTSDLNNDSGYIDENYHDSTKQDLLTAGENITIEKVGDNLVISSTGGSGASYKAGDNIKIEKKSELLWRMKEWQGITDFNGQYIWTDGDNVYYSCGFDQCVLDKTTSAWTPKTWTGLTNFFGNYIWTDGNNIYYSNGNFQYVLDKETDTWNEKTWDGFSNILGMLIWSFYYEPFDAEIFVCSMGNQHYSLFKGSNQWNLILDDWISFPGNCVWKNGEDIYVSIGQTYKFNFDLKKSSWNLVESLSEELIQGDRVWTEGENIYYSNEGDNIHQQYVLNKDTLTWKDKSWGTGLYIVIDSGADVWTDGENTYYSNNGTNYQLTQVYDDKESISVFTDLTELDIEKMFSDELDSNAVFEEGEEGDILNVQNAYFEPNGDNYTLVINTDDANYENTKGGSILVLNDNIVEINDGE